MFLLPFAILLCLYFAGIRAQEPLISLTPFRAASEVFDQQAEQGPEAAWGRQDQSR